MIQWDRQLSAIRIRKCLADVFKGINIKTMHMQIKIKNKIRAAAVKNIKINIKQTSIKFVTVNVTNMDIYESYTYQIIRLIEPTQLITVII